MLSRLERFLRVAQPGPRGAVVIGSRQIYILPTRYGFGYALLVGLVLIGGVNYGNNLAMFLAFLLAGVGAAAMFQTWRNLLGLELEVETAQPVFQGEQARFGLRLRSARPRPAVQAAFAHGDPIALDLDSTAAESLELAVPAERRGELRPGMLVVASRYPLGLLHAWCRVTTEASCLVYPRPAQHWQIPAAPAYTGSESGDRGVGADDFVALRRYRPGDSPRHLDWKALARERGALTRQFGGDRAERRWLDWDSLSARDVETRLSQLCRGVLDCERGGIEYGLRLPGVEIAAARGHAHREQCLAALARHGAAAT